jgi:glycosyltransferase involved in cell wall biosynthesis
MGVALDVSVVICAYSEDRWNDLVAAIDSVRAQTLPAREIVVVVDHNRGLLERVAAHLPCVVMAENRETRGLSGARNTGVAVSQGKVIAFLDDDAVAAPDWLERLATLYEDQRTLGVGGPVEPIWLSGRPAWFPEEFDWVVGCSFRGMPETAAAVRGLIGCNMSIRREIFQRVGGFSSRLGRVGMHPCAGEETEFCIRANQHWPQGLWMYEPSALVQHRVPAGRACWRYYRSRCYAEGLSKSRIAHLAGARDGLASEWTYTFRVLPRGLRRAIGDATLSADPAGIARAGAIVAGLLITITGYLQGMASEWFALWRRPVCSSDRGLKDSIV